MNKIDILSHVDYTLLKPTADWEAIKKLCRESVANKTASVCIPPAYVKRVKKEFPELNICTVIGFPLGYQTTETKVFETKNAIENGALEIDAVVNLGDVKNQDFPKITEEIKALKNACGDKILKIIVETCYLTEGEKIKMCHAVTAGGADFIKTSTGFGTGGAELIDIKLFKEHIGKGVKIKAAGGIKTMADAEKFIENGALRIGASSLKSTDAE
ncbi:MAG: deoxyribose-phosphate aldolase [Clostridiales bacterium]